MRLKLIRMNICNVYIGTQCVYANYNVYLLGTKIKDNMKAKLCSIQSKKNCLCLYFNIYNY
jgi:hypothetical protein